MRIGGRASRVIVVLALAAIALLFVPSSASAATCPTPAHNTCEGFLYWRTTSDQGWQGTRVSIGNPAGSQMNVVSGDFAHSTAEADDQSGELIQQGVHWRNHSPYPGGGTCTSNSLEYFVEILHGSAADCYTEGAANTTDTNLQEVLRGSGGNWRAYMNGDWKDGVETSWTPCGGDACQISSFGEEREGNSNTEWAAKFAGSQSYPWKFWNGTVWSQINNCSHYYDTGWGGSGPFPGGIWTLWYNEGGRNTWGC